jgi:hypothetical protein
MQNLSVMRMVYVSKYAEELSVDVFSCRGEGLTKIATRFSWEYGFVVKEVLNPGHHVVDIGGSWKLDTSAILVDPRVIQSWCSVRITVLRERGAGLTMDPQTWQDMIAGCSIRKPHHRTG